MRETRVNMHFTILVLVPVVPDKVVYFLIVSLVQRRIRGVAMAQRFQEKTLMRLKI